MRRYFHDIIIAVESLIANKTKSILTALGIIFGVAAVISMMAIGKGAKKEILEQMKMVGVNNIVITPVVKDESNSDNSSDNQEGEKQKNKFSPGLTLLDAESIRKVIPSVDKISPEISLNSYVMQHGKRSQAKIVGVSRDFFTIYNLELVEGALFSRYQEDHGLPVCIIGHNIKAKFFSHVDPVGQYIKFGNVWLKVIGVLQKSEVNLSAFDNAGVNVYNDNIYIPVKTMLMRFENRALINTKRQNTITIYGFGFISVRSSSANQNTTANYNQLDRIVVQVKKGEQLLSTTAILSRMFQRRHLEVKDFEITVPELLLKQQQRTKDIFNIVLGAIASISLIVGGIGIMNIMFASVMERIKEIGTRMAIGAKKKDIVIQFLAEAILISVSGGLVGILLGIFLAKAIYQIAGVLTIVSPGAVIVAFTVSVAVGVIFGYSPAKRASEKDPIESLRHE